MDFFNLSTELFRDRLLPTSQVNLDDLYTPVASLSGSLNYSLHYSLQL